MRKKVLIIAPILLFLVGTIGLITYRIIFLKMIRVPTGAMANTIIPGDCLVAKQLAGEVKRGDIIIFKYPNQPAIQYVARVVGLPGETIQVRDPFVFINGDAISEQRVWVKTPYAVDVGVLEENSTEGSGPYRVFYHRRDGNSKPTLEQAHLVFGVKEPLRIPDNNYFVMGDNRDNSLDSRYKGTVPRDLIWGKPSMIYWSSHEDGSHRERIKWDRLGKRVN